MNQKKFIFAAYFESKMAKNKKQVNTEEFEELTSTENFIDQYKKPLLIGGGAIIAIVLGIIGYQKLISEPHELESKDAYWNAFYEFEKDSLNLAVNGNENFAGMEEVAADYSGTSGGNIANYTLGIAAMERGEFDNAVGYFDACDFEDIVMGSMVIGLKGDCHIEMDDYSTAADLFEEAADREANEFTTPMYLKKAGLAYEALGETDKALAAYQKIKDNWENSEEAADIDKYITRAQN